MGKLNDENWAKLTPEQQSRVKEIIAESKSSEIIAKREAARKAYFARLEADRSKKIDAERDRALEELARLTQELSEDDL